MLRLLLALSLAAKCLPSNGSTVISTGSKNVAEFFHVHEGGMALLQKQTVLSNMTFGVFDNDTQSLYFVSETGGNDGFVSRWKVVSTSQPSIHNLQTVEGLGKDPCHLSISHGLLHVSSCGSGSFRSYKLTSSGDISDHQSSSLIQGLFVRLGKWNGQDISLPIPRPSKHDQGQSIWHQNKAKTEAFGLKFQNKHGILGLRKSTGRGCIFR